jgi:uncharacterized protein (DUF2249 family)
MSDIELDVRHLPPPEPFERALLALRRLSPGSTLVLRIHREPFPLYDVLAERGFTHTTTVHGPGDVEVRVRHAGG